MRVLNVKGVIRRRTRSSIFRWCSILIASLLFTSSGVLASKPRFRIIYPLENQEIAARDSSFIFGSITPVSRLWINDTPVRVYPNGAFLAFLPVTPGEFVFYCTAVSGSDTTRVERRVRVTTRMMAYPVDSLGFDPTYIHPDFESVLRGGDIFEVSVKGTPGCRAFFDIEGLAWEIPMTEQMPLPQFPWGDAVFGDLKTDTTFVQGIYTGVYEIKPWDLIKDARVVFHLVNAESDTISIQAKGTLTVDGSSVPTIAVLTEETVIARPSPGQAYTWFLPKGVKLWLTGRRGVWYRARLAEGHEAWVPDGSFQVLPPGTPIPKGIVRFVRAEGLPDRVRISIPLEERLPFHIRQRMNPSSLIITLYGVASDTDWIPQDFSDPVLRDIRWYQRSSRVYELEILLDQPQQWGYDPKYNGTTLEIDIKKRPKIPGWPSSPFKNCVICLDAGHNPDMGAVGPTGLQERDVNIAVAGELKRMLESDGAIVVMTREASEGISLRSRPRLADAVDADILISIHFNALPDGVNPWKNNGSSVYYYHPMSRRLAELIHQEVLEELKLPDFGLYYANLALCRPTQMPAVLTEEAFMMIPEQEMLLYRPDFRKKCAKAIYEGIKRFLKENR
jgi:N-acetylmuramoyl-L-alanine amidase